jgi:penicillin-binding protein 2
VRPLHLFSLISVFYAVLSLHLFRLQVVDYGEYKTLSERNRIRPVILEAPRGVILDRYGRELVSNRLAFDCYLIPQESKEYLDDVLARLGAILAESKESLEATYRARKTGAFTPVAVAEDIPKETAIQIEEASDALPGVFVKTRPVRQYNIGKAGAHVLGYVGPVSSVEYKDLKGYGYRMVDLLGKTGIEKAYESYLKGKNGAVQYETDSRGRLLRVLSIQEPEEGKPLQLTIDMDLQLLTTGLLEGLSGAVVVMDLETGGILALVSSPAFDPGIFGRPREREARRAAFADPQKPLINRAIAGLYPPGSTFKIVTAHAALKAGKITEHTDFFCPGYFMMGRHRFNCWRREGHGRQNVVEGLEHSCNVFFYNTGSRLDVSVLASEARDFGLGQKSDIDLPGEKGGLVPTREWKRKALRQEWYGGETVIFAIGQGYLLVTPLQIMRAAAVAALNGYLVPPHLARKIGDVEVEPKRARKIATGKYMAKIREGLLRVVQSPTGTGQRAKSAAVEVSGKTGTAQATSGPDHAWFVGYAPSPAPSASVVVFIEHGGKGGVSAAKVAGQTLTWMAENGYFR